MSKFTRNTSLALAVAAAFAVAAPAMAANVNNGTITQPYVFNMADVDIVPTATLPAGGAAFSVGIATSDQIIGRTTGFSVKITLPTGVTFGALTVAAGAQLPAGWTPAVAAGTGAGQNVAVITVSPAANAPGITPGQILNFTGVTVKGAKGSVSATVNFFDPVTTNDILNSIPFSLITSVDALQYTVNIANPDQRIDVGANAGPSRTLFSPSGRVNSSSDTTSFDAGTVVIANPPLPLPSGPIFDQTGAGFAWANATSPGDTVDLALVGNFATFQATGGAIYLGAVGTCAPAAPNGAITATINAGGTSADFGAQPFASVAAMDICFIAPGGTVTINPTQITANVTATRALTSKSDTGSASALAMAYNGPVQVVYVFNPANNSNQQSFVRISNTSGAGGQISITGVDDTGHAGAGPVTFTLGAQQSVQLNSSDLENGNAAKGLTGSLGAGTGKWILTVVGQVGSMEVTNLNRNNSSGTLNNLGNPVTNDGRIQ